MLVKKAQSLEKAIRKAGNILHNIGLVALMVLMLLGAFDVIGRYVFNRPIKGTLEISQILMATVVIFGWAYTQKVGGHIKVELITRRYPPRVRSILNFIGCLLGLVIFSLIGWRSAVTSILRWQQHELIQTIQIPVSPFIMFVTFGAFFICLEFIIQMIHLIPDMKRRH